MKKTSILPRNYQSTNSEGDIRVSIRTIQKSPMDLKPSRVKVSTLLWLASSGISLGFMLLLILLFGWGPLAVHGEEKGMKRVHAKIRGEVKMGETFEKAFGSDFNFHLEPNPYGWTIVIRDERGMEDLSRLTPPFHFVPNPREIEGWHLRNEDNSGPNESGEKNVNAPGLTREFIFSPEVGKTVDGPDTKRKPTPEEIEKIRRFGRGELRILDYRLGDLVPGKRAAFEWMRFEVDLSWPAEKKSDQSSSRAIRVVFDPGVERTKTLQGKRNLIEKYLSSVEKEILALLEEYGLPHVFSPRNWRDDLIRQSESPEFRSYGVELWSSNIAEKRLPYLNIRCNVLCINQISMAAEAPTCSISKPEEDIRFDWYVKTGIRSLDQTIQNRLPIWSGF